ncbi:hypothetical protein ACQKOH_00290 [Sphingomonas sp. NPDC092331]|jgi:hypothetical protein|uniref:hypothetical protein n=1 Tax=unclassified Sphingomonas TaxID=196159 RepID=UPI0031F51D62
MGSFRQLATMIRHVHETHVHGITEEDGEEVALAQAEADTGQPGFVDAGQVTETEDLQA